MDKTIINLLTILVSGSGLFVVLTKFNVPELNMLFLGENPYALKRDIIDNVMTWTFTSLALFGLLFQVAGEIFGRDVPERIHRARFYLLFFVIGSLSMVLAVWFLTGFGNWIARRAWLPVVVENQRQLFRSSLFVVEHDGWREDQVSVKDKIEHPQSYKDENLKTASNRISQIEKVLDLPQSPDDLKTRIERLKPYFR